MTIQLHCESSDQWLVAAMEQFDRFLLDHAANEKKASSSTLTLAAHYPDKPDLMAAMIDLAIGIAGAGGCSGVAVAGGDGTTG
jgi:tRNA 2-(methylsulfanyl)-N6-isopentenyladenosine37 hydroxylase